jgi:Omp85 superfamily domain
MVTIKSRVLLILVLAVLLGLNIQAQEKQGFFSAFKDSEDGAFDISDWLVQRKGLLILPSIITEPAVGYGAAAAAVYFHSAYSEKNGPPSMTGGFGAATENGTWAGGVFHEGIWKQDRIRYRGALARMYANLAYYGSGDVSILGDQSINLNLDAWVVLQQIKFRLANSNFFLGGSYLYLNTDNTFEMPVDIPEFNGTEFSSTLSEATMILNFDSRNNVFTPTSGVFLELSGTYSDTWFGGEDQYGRIGASALGFFPAARKVVIGIRYESRFSLGAVPFWARPIISMRGVPLTKYQNKNTTLMEAEIDWNLYKRWSLVGFTGIGNAYSSFEEFDKGKTVRTLGTGFRYMIARKLGTNMGIDVAFSNDDWAFYIVFGSAWLK